MKRSAADIIEEYGPFPGVESVHGVTYDGRRIWFGSGDRLNGFDPDGEEAPRVIDVSADAGTAYDGAHLFQIAGEHIQKIDPESGSVVSTVPLPGAAKAELVFTTMVPSGLIAKP